MLDFCQLRHAIVVGFPMGGGEIARYIARYGEEQLHSVVFASAVAPYLCRTPGYSTARCSRSCGYRPLERSS